MGSVRRAVPFREGSCHERRRALHPPVPRDAETVTLAKVLVLPDTPTLGSRLDLGVEGVEDALTVVGLTLRPGDGRPGREAAERRDHPGLGAARQRGSRAGTRLERAGASRARQGDVALLWPIHTGRSPRKVR